MKTSPGALRAAIAAQALSMSLLSGCGGGSATGPSQAVAPPPAPAPTPAPAPGPKPTMSGEVYALADPGEGQASVQHFLAMPDVDGIAWRGLWRMVEPSDGSYDWSSLDATLDSAAANNKRVTVHIGASGGAWPAWLTAAGVATYDGTSPLGSPFTDPVPWDSVYISRYQRLMMQLATHIAGRGQTGLVRAVSVGAPVSEMSLVSCTSGTLGTGAATVAYNRSAYLSAWTSAAQAVLTAFSATPVVVSAPVAQICAPDGDGSLFYSDLMRVIPNAQVFVADLKAQGSFRYGQVSGEVLTRPLLAQMVWSATNDPSNRLGGTLSSAICAGRGQGARYFEIYKVDLDSADAAIRTAIAQARGTTACP